MSLTFLHLLELFAALSAAIGATFVMFPWRSGWFFLFLSGLLYIFIFFSAKLYATLVLQTGFALLSLYGLLSWHRKSRENKIFRPVIAPFSLLLRDLAIAALGSIFWAQILLSYSDDPHPYLDGFLSIYAMLAQYWMSRAYLLCWFLWILADGFYAFALFCWGLKLSSLLYAYLAGLSIIGFFHWRNLLAKNP